MATGRIGPNEPTVWSSNAMVTRSAGLRQLAQTRQPQRSFERRAHGGIEIGQRRQSHLGVAGQPTRVGRQRGRQRSIAVRQLDVHAGGSQPRAWNARNHLRNMSSVSMQSWNPACRALIVLTSVVGGVCVAP